MYPEGLSMSLLTGEQQASVYALCGALDDAAVCVSSVRYAVDPIAVSLVESVFPKVSVNKGSDGDAYYASYPPFSEAGYLYPLDEALGTLLEEVLRHKQDSSLEGALGIPQLDRHYLIRLGAASTRVALLAEKEVQRSIE